MKLIITFITVGYPQFYIVLDTCFIFSINCMNLSLLFNFIHFPYKISEKKILFFVKVF